MNRNTRWPTYRSFYAAKNRCENSQCENFNRYGGRGIKFLFKDFEEFFAELGERPPGLQLDRINNNGHYEPGNVRWATRVQQQNNTRTNRFLTAFGRTQTVAQWAREKKIHPDVLRYRVDHGLPVEKALTAPQNTLRSPVGLTGARAHPVTAFGRTQLLSQWAKQAGLSWTSLSKRLAMGWSPERAVSEPPRRQARLIAAFGKTKFLAVWAREYKIHETTLAKRLQSGMNPEAALIASSLRAKLTPDLVRRMRAEHRRGRITKATLSRKYGVSSRAVSDVLNRRMWRHVT